MMSAGTNLVGDIRAGLTIGANGSSFVPSFLSFDWLRLTDDDAGPAIDDEDLLRLPRMIGGSGTP